jgi:hypothetical protein
MERKVQVQEQVQENYKDIFYSLSLWERVRVRA